MIQVKKSIIINKINKAFKTFPNKIAMKTMTFINYKSYTFIIKQISFFWIPKTNNEINTCNSDFSKTKDLSSQCFSRFPCAFLPQKNK